jgi:hypothetical protein
VAAAVPLDIMDLVVTEEQLHLDLIYQLQVATAQTEILNIKVAPAELVQAAA